MSLLLGWCRRPGLNRGPTDYESVALPLSYVGDLVATQVQCARYNGRATEVQDKLLLYSPFLRINA